MSLFRTAAPCLLLSVGLVAGNSATAGAQEVDAAAVLAVVEPQVTIELRSEEAAAVEGVVLFRSEGNHTEVALEIRGAPAGQELSGTLLSGSCSDDGAPLAELGEIEVDGEGVGRLTTELPVPLEAIATRSISVEVGEGNGVLACGDRDPAPAEEPTSGDAPNPAATPVPAPAPAPEPQP